MTDYLELLLETEEAEEETAVEWETPVIFGLEREPGGAGEKAELARRQTAAGEGGSGWTVPEKAAQEGGDEWTAPKMAAGKGGGWTEPKMTAEERQYRVQDVPEMLAKETGTADRISSWERAIARNRTEEAAGGVLAGVESSTQLYQQVRKLRRAAEIVRGESRGTERTAVVRQEGTPGLTVEGMDRAVQRDARRYDGGFGLY